MNNRESTLIQCNNSAPLQYKTHEKCIRIHIIQGNCVACWDMFSTDLWLSNRSYSGVIFPYFRHSHQYSICVLPGPCTGGRGFRFQNPLEAISSFITISHSLPFAPSRLTHAASACSPVWPRGPSSRKHRGLTELRPTTFNLPDKSRLIYESNCS